MSKTALLALRVTHHAAVFLGVGIAAAKLYPHLRVDPVGHVRRVASSLERDTTPVAARIVYRELNGYFPLPPSAVWEVETDADWTDYEKDVRKQLEGSFRILPGQDGDALYCVDRFGGEVQYLWIELVTDNKPLRIRCTLTVAVDTSE